MAQRQKPKPLTKHVDRTTTPYGGLLTLDLTSFKTLLVTLPKGARKGLRTEQEGLADVLAELAVAIPANGAAAGVPAALYTALTTNNTNITQLKPLLQTATLIVEALGATIAVAEDLREQQISQIADCVQSTAKRMKNEGIKTPFKQTLAYKNKAAEKAVKTRAAKKTTAPTAATTTPAAAAPAATTPAAATAPAATSTSASGH